MHKKTLTVLLLVSCLTSSLSASFALKRQLDGAYKEVTQEIKATRNPALCIGALDAYLEVYRQLPPDSLETKHTERHESLTSLLDQYAEKLASKAISTSDTNRSVQAIELSQFLQKIRPSKLDVYEERINSLERIASSGSAKLKIDAFLLKCRNELSEGVIQLPQYKQLVYHINQNISVLSPEQKDVIGQFEIQLLKHFESYASFGVGKPLAFDLEELSLRFTVCQVFGGVIGNSADYEKVASKFGREVALKLDTFARNCGDYFDDRLSYLKLKDRLDYNNLPADINDTTAELREKLAIIARVAKIIKGSKGLNYSVVTYLDSATLATAERQDLNHIIDIWQYLELVATQNVLGFASAYDRIPEDFIRNRIGRGADLVASGTGCFTALVNKEPSYAHAQRAEYLRSIDALFNSVSFKDSYQDLLKESLALQVGAVSSLRDLRASLEQYAFIDSKNPAVVDASQGVLKELVQDLGNGKAIEAHYTEYGFYSVCAEMYELNSFIVEYAPGFQVACGQSFHRGFIKSGIPEIKLCQRIEDGLLNTDFDLGRYKKLQKIGLADYKKLYKDAPWQKQGTMRTPNEIKTAFELELKHIKYVTPVSKKDMEQFISRDGLFGKVLSSVHRKRMNLDVLKGVSRLLDDNDILDLCLPAESMLRYYYSYQQPPGTDWLFVIYEDCATRTFMTSLLPNPLEIINLIHSDPIRQL
jgi:hypothetical protein